MKKSTVLLTLAGTALLFISFATGCNDKTDQPADAAASTFNAETAKTEIIAANNEFKAFFAAKDSVGLAGLYAQDAKFMMNGSPAISGRSNIQSAISGIMNSGVSAVELITVDVWGKEGLVVEEGELALYVGDQQVDQGKYLVLWKKEDGKWHLFRDIFNSNLSPK